MWQEFPRSRGSAPVKLTTSKGYSLVAHSPLHWLFLLDPNSSGMGNKIITFREVLSDTKSFPAGGDFLGFQDIL